MPFIPHTTEDICVMLKAIGVESIDQLFEEIPAALRSSAWENLPDPLNELQVDRLMRERAGRDGRYLNFIGAGAYEHHIPAAVWQVATRGEYYSSYTPYQAEASQGTLQAIYEYQSMMASLTAMDVANASLYDGASALAEAVLMAVRVHGNARRVMMPRTVHPIWRRAVKTIVRNQEVELIDVPYDESEGCIQSGTLPRPQGRDIAALVVQQPNFFGVLEPMDELTDWAHRHQALVIAVANPVSLAILKPPGEWGGKGADIAVGSGQPLGIPLSGGGPHVGYMACRREFMRQMPGRVVGRTVDVEGRAGYTLTLQAREQHIRRSKATSNICTNQGLMVTAATIHLALLGPEGLRRVAETCHGSAMRLLNGLTAIHGVERAFRRPMFHEFVLRLKTPLAPVLRALGAQGILGGLSLVQDYPELGQSLLVCVTETKNGEDLTRYTEHMGRIISKRFRPGPFALKPAT